MLSARNLTCVRAQRTLFSELSFSVNAGDIVQVEGANGAGKTSLLRILAGLSRPDSGEVLWQQSDIWRQRADYHAALLYLGHLPGVKAALTPLENLQFWYAGLPESALWQALDEVELSGYEDLPVAQLSAGQQRRVALARLWLSQATLWILDEPLTAIDKQGVSALISLFARHAEQGGAVVLTTHQDLPFTQSQLRRIALTAEEEL